MDVMPESEGQLNGEGDASIYKNGDKGRMDGAGTRMRRSIAGMNGTLLSRSLSAPVKRDGPECSIEPPVRGDSRRFRSRV